MATPYQNIAKSALINWNDLSEEEASKKIQNESVQELENQVYAMNSIKYAIAGIAKETKLSKEETLKFTEAVIYGPDNAEIFKKVSEKAKDLSEQQQINVLSVIHNGWVKDNSNEKTFNKKIEKQQLRQYAPLELIGWNEVKSDLLFLNPILESINININEENLENKYHENVSSYLKENKINDQESLKSIIESGHDYYQELPEDLEMKLSIKIHDVVQQIIDNWNKKDPQSAKIFQERESLKGNSLK